MGTRRDARERAVQFLFQCDLNPPEDLETALREFWETQPFGSRDSEPAAKDPAAPGDSPAPTVKEAALRLFAEELIRGTLAERDALDRQIERLARNWAVNRMAVMDRNILRLSMHEMQRRRDVPAVVSINEAVEIAKRYSTDDSGKFVNGILDNFRKSLDRPAAPPSA
ncbi:MAG: transcription antitermination factor NusB [Verrucomicrobiales bacterium]|nr:transcription antitermination factor NusB [Verrucomicrobiales bacterium]MCP5526479.1 transcription antitermination factor NusB [Verrucomicrobiales bacterium]